MCLCCMSVFLLLPGHSHLLSRHVLLTILSIALFWRQCQRSQSCMGGEADENCQQAVLYPGKAMLRVCVCSLLFYNHLLLPGGFFFCVCVIQIKFWSTSSVTQTLLCATLFFFLDCVKGCGLFVYECVWERGHASLPVLPADTKCRTVVLSGAPTRRLIRRRAVWWNGR